MVAGWFSSFIKQYSSYVLVKTVRIGEENGNGLLEASRFFGMKRGVIVTGDFEGQEEVDGVRIEYIPLWKWLLVSTP